MKLEFACEQNSYWGESFSRRLMLRLYDVLKCVPVVLLSSVRDIESRRHFRSHSLVTIKIVCKIIPKVLTVYINSTL